MFVVFLIGFSHVGFVVVVVVLGGGGGSCFSFLLIAVLTFHM